MKPIERAIYIAGGLTELSRRLGLSPQVVSNWRTRGVPAEKCPDIERETNGEVRCEELRPEVDWAYLRKVA